MPNWINNNIVGSKTLINKYLNGNGDFDFNKVIKMPEELDIEDGSRIDFGLRWLYHHNEDISHQDIKDALKSHHHYTQEPVEDYPNASARDVRLALTALSNYKTYGYLTWYEWCWDHWGTKWNAGDSYLEEEDDNKISVSFSTAWNTPDPIWHKIIKDNPTEEFFISFDNDAGNETTLLTIKNGEIFKKVNVFENEDIE